MVSDRYLHALPGFSYLFCKHWSPQQDVIVCGFSVPHFELPPNFTFFSIGRQTEYPFKRWSDALIRVLESFPREEFFVLMLEDYFLIQPVRLDVVRKCHDYMRQFRYVLKFDLCADRRFAGGVVDYGAIGDIPIVKSDPGSAYHSSLMTGIWNRELMLRYLLVPGESPHDVEIIGTPRLAARGDDLLVLGTKIDPWPVRHTLAFRTQEPGVWMLDELPHEDLAELRERKFVP